MPSPRRPLDIVNVSAKELVQQSLADFTREDLFIAIPATVTNVDDYESKQVVDVKPVINDVYEDAEITRAVTLGSVFVKLPSGGGFSIKLPIAVGDLVTLHYAHRDISTYLDGDGGDIDNPLSMVADIRDCWVTHGFGTRNANQKPSKTDFIIEGDNTTITIKPSGEVTVETEGTSYLRSSKHTIDTDVEITGTLKVVGNVTNEANVTTTGTTTSATVAATNSLTIDSKEMKGHKHSQANDSAGNTEQDTGSPI